MKPSFQFLVGHVFAEPRKNRPPVAIVSPQYQEISLPTTSTVIDGSREYMSQHDVLEEHSLCTLVKDLQPAVSEYCLDQSSWPC